MCAFQLGIDVSKAKLDCALRLANGKLRNKVVTNSAQGFEALLVWVNKQGVNRLMHRSILLEFEGKSYRLKEAAALTRLWWLPQWLLELPGLFVAAAPPLPC